MIHPLSRAEAESVELKPIERERHLRELGYILEAAKKRCQRARRAAEEALADWRRKHTAAGLLEYEAAALKHQMEVGKVLGVERTIAETIARVDTGPVSRGDARQ